MLRVTFADRPTVQFIFLAYALIAVSANSRSADNLQALNERITALESVRLGDSEDTLLFSPNTLQPCVPEGVNP
jgi:hypothetical protein